MNGEALVASPCNNVCRIDAASGWCLGCHRTIAEIAAWSSLDDAQKKVVLDALPQRHMQADADAAAEGPRT